MLDAILQGLLLGGLYSLFATGLSLAFGVMRFANIAHGDLIVLAAYLGLVVTGALGLHPLAAALVIVPAMGLLGYLAQRGMFNRVAGGDVVSMLLLTFGLSVVIQNGLLGVFSADSRRLASGDLVTASVPLGGDLALGVFPLLTLALAVGSIALLEWVFARTAIGRAFRATSDDRVTAQLMGLDIRHVYGLAMAVSFALCGLAGILLGIGTTFDPSLGPTRLLFAFEAVIIGGLGSLWGTLAGGLILGVAQTIGFRASPGWGLLAGHLAFLAVLAVRPQGLFPRTRDR
jgi:branched-chain amino acid transport system permease protein